MKSIIFIIILCTIAGSVLILNCDKNPVAPHNIRELTWTVDTLAHPDNWQSLIYDIWGSSAHDIYAAGGANTTRGILWHYDGKRWTDIPISITKGGPIKGPIGFTEVLGFGKDDVWVCGNRLHSNPNPPPNFFATSLLSHYDGEDWQEIITPEGESIQTFGRWESLVWKTITCF